MAGIAGIEAMICLAQIQHVDPAFLREWLLVALTVFGLVAVGMTLWLRARPQRRDVKMLEQFVTSEQCAIMQRPIESRVARIEGEVVQLREQLKKDREELDQANEARISRLHQRIDKLNDDLKEMPSKVVTELLNTRNLWTQPHGPR